MIQIVDINQSNVHEKGFFCMRSKSKSKGYQNKLNWLLSRFEEGLKLKIIEDDGHPKGFIEYTPIENSWRAVKGESYLFIHCLWIVGQGKGKGYGSKLLMECIREAKAQEKSGVAMITSNQTWLADKTFFTKYGFISIDIAPPSFELIVNRFNEDKFPVFIHGWEERARKYNSGITIIKSDQCPYIEEAVKTIIETANDRGINTTVIDINSAEEARLAPTAYGVFNVVYNGIVLTYHPVNKRELNKLLDMQV